MIVSFFNSIQDASFASRATFVIVYLFYSIPRCIICITRQSRASVPFFSSQMHHMHHTPLSCYCPFFIQFRDASYATHTTLVLVSLYSVPRCLICITGHSRAASVQFLFSSQMHHMQHTPLSWWCPFFIQFRDASYAIHAILVLVSLFYTVPRCILCITRHSRASVPLFSSQMHHTPHSC